jgi:type IV pilus assembly protein PilM
MATGNAVWGIDIGQCALKALRCTLHEDGHTVVAEAFDYIEYPKILSQPEAEPDELIRDAIRTFLSRNNVKGDRVAVSVSGQSGLARFFKPPPVEAKKIDDIVIYEARQQIPFSLDEVVYQYQQMPGAAEEDGIALDTEIGLFAMKREQVFKALEPFQEAGIDVDLVQLGPLCLYNYVAHDLLAKRFAEIEDYDSEDPPESLILLSIGTDSTDLVVTNGFRVWQRSIPLGGNHFTKQLTQELKLTFAKAEHLKRNARQAEDPKTIFKAMRPVFNDLVTEVQRSLSYFQSIDRNAKLGKMVAVGKAVKLPGLMQYLGKNLGREIDKIETFHVLAGSSVTNSPAFRDNLPAFPTSYGLCVQALNRGKLYTNLLPQEISTARMIEGKKPWIVAVLATVMLAVACHVALQWRAWRSVHLDAYKPAESQVTSVTRTSQQWKSLDDEKLSEVRALEAIGEQVVGTTERRLIWLEFLKALNRALPYEPDLKRDLSANPPDWEVSEKPLMERPDIHIQSVDCVRVGELSDWFNDEIQKKYNEAREEAEAEGEAADAGDDEEGAGPEGKGWIVQLRGYHYYNQDRSNQGAEYVRRTLLKNLEEMELELSVAEGKYTKFTMKELGISFPVLTVAERPRRVPNPLKRTEEEAVPAKGGLAGTVAPTEKAAVVDDGRPAEVLICEFTMQFCWQESTLTERLEKRKLSEQTGDSPEVAMSGN